jgi:hypothetical protein
MVSSGTSSSAAGSAAFALSVAFALSAVFLHESQSGTNGVDFSQSQLMGFVATVCVLTMTAPSGSGGVAAHPQVGFPSHGHFGVRLSTIFGLWNSGCSFLQHGHGVGLSQHPQSTAVLVTSTVLTSGCSFLQHGHGVSTIVVLQHPHFFAAGEAMSTRPSVELIGATKWGGNELGATNVSLPQELQSGAGVLLSQSQDGFAWQDLQSGAGVLALQSQSTMIGWWSFSFAVSSSACLVHLRGQLGFAQSQPSSFTTIGWESSTVWCVALS